MQPNVRSLTSHIFGILGYTMDAKTVARLRRMVWRHYERFGRHHLPWRLTFDPYHILVSELMLQQTQVARVIPKYHEFLARFPTIDTLAEASLRDVLVVWQGLGYNRRARMLHEAAIQVVTRHRGRIPHTYAELVALPGVGPYTARAIGAFAYNQDGGMVETNIRTVLFHNVLVDRSDVSDAELLQLTVALCPRGRAREWYWALMDYGAYLKEQGVRVNTKSKHYVKQSTFAGSDRQIRGAIVRLLAREHTLTEHAIIEKIEAVPERVRAQLAGLQRDGLIVRNGGDYELTG